MSVIKGDWSTVDDVFESFAGERWDCLEELKQVDRTGVEIVYAWYSYENYSGKAFVLFLKDGKLYEVNANHCSCYRLEGQWSPEKTTLDSLQLRASTWEPSEWREDEPNLEGEAIVALFERGKSV